MGISQDVFLGTRSSIGNPLGIPFGNPSEHSSENHLKVPCEDSSKDPFGNLADFFYSRNLPGVKFKSSFWKFSRMGVLQKFSFSGILF